MGGEIVAWLLKLVAGEKIKEELGKKGLKKQIRVLNDALAESQEFRKEYAEALEMVQRIAADRDLYHREMMRLRIEVADLTKRNAALEAELAEAKARQRKGEAD